MSDVTMRSNKDTSHVLGRLLDILMMLWPHKCCVHGFQVNIKSEIKHEDIQRNSSLNMWNPALKVPEEGLLDQRAIDGYLICEYGENKGL